MCLNVFCDLCIKWSTVIGYVRGSSRTDNFCRKNSEADFTENCVKEQQMIISLLGRQSGLNCLIDPTFVLLNFIR